MINYNPNESAHLLGADSIPDSVLYICHSVNSFNLHSHPVSGWHDSHLTDEEIESLVQESPQGLTVSNWRNRYFHLLIADSIAWAFLLPICIAGGFLLSDLFFSVLLGLQAG